ncbi:phage tail protein [Vibrio nigripulchritudo]|uniref:phage tail protein n=1 Tax=Vibrio nigripulchritudo TaxID=28173 RepID=UPI0003B1F7A4|nr:tail fiber protein [Vibrio nigripulchritudo]CCN73597.1 putative Phage tail collar domain protein [Vibrio nigripulchritudo SFn118]
MEPFIGQIIMFAGNYAPRDWAFCHGQLLSIHSYPVLYSVIGNNYGGDGRTTFALPDLRGRVPVQAGLGPGLKEKLLGEQGGRISASLSPENMPEASVSIKATTEKGDSTVPTEGCVLAATKGTSGFDRDEFIYKMKPQKDKSVSMQSATVNGGGTPFDIEQPYLALNYIIALQGIYPPRS